ncbi:acyl-CoA thioesterase-1 [Arthrobacter sp. V4I6]|uniref:SGNH/GDSL hydrolase family protein n=1 Tax=unclassified Arthrobacter TaxID=235627 RepID=UPI0027824CD0|nr:MULTISPECIES: SGNH/GDSL hydrolase family protein [unclassified Arthrobacter]MDQ0820099.1 acyl-CoA thioesterase-1 [Arthrobacter sp. V1I7]MDQ0854281.1 acyl-CoA thioesterase-1 [Arthrobacter sp. V4I6]
MRNATALFRFLAPMIAAGVLVGGCGQATPPQPYNPDVCAASTLTTPAPGPDAGPDAGPDPATMPPCSIHRNPASGREEVVLKDLGHTALLIGDSQSAPAVGWPRRALTAVGYHVYYCGAGGTGFVAANGKTGNYSDALDRGDWRLPYGSPALVVIQGGGNDATKGASDGEITANAERLIGMLRQRYPGATLAMIGTLALGADHGGGRRTEVDTLLGTVAAKRGIPFVSVGDWMTRYDLLQYASDRVHLDTEGHRKLGTILGTMLKDMRLQAEDR